MGRPFASARGSSPEGTQGHLVLPGSQICDRRWPAARRLQAVGLRPDFDHSLRQSAPDSHNRSLGHILPGASARIPRLHPGRDAVRRRLRRRRLRRVLPQPADDVAGHRRGFLRPRSPPDEGRQRQLGTGEHSRCRARRLPHPKRLGTAARHLPVVPISGLHPAAGRVPGPALDRQRQVGCHDGPGISRVRHRPMVLPVSSPFRAGNQELDPCLCAVWTLQA